MIDIIIITKDNPGVLATLCSLHKFRFALPRSTAITVFDASIDDTLEKTCSLLDLLEEYFDNVSYVHLSPCGIYQTFNTACLSLSQQFVLFLNAGDLFWPFTRNMKFVNIHMCILSDPQCIHVFSAFVNRSGRPLLTYKSCLVVSCLAPLYNFFLSRLHLPLFGMPTFQQSILYPVGVFSSTGLFFEPSLFPISDYHHLCRAARHYRIVRHPGICLSNYNYEGVSSVYGKPDLRLLHRKAISDLFYGANLPDDLLFVAFLPVVWMVKRIKWALRDIVKVFHSAL